MIPLFLRRALYTLGTLCLIWSCGLSNFDDLELAPHDAEFVFPLFRTTITLEELMKGILNDSLSGDTILVNPDGTMTLIYSGDLVSKPALDLFSFFPDTLIPLPDTLSELDFDAPNSIRVDRVDFTGGSIGLVAYNGTSGKVDLTMSLPGMTKNGVVFEQTKQLVAGEFYQGPLIPINGYTLVSNNNKLQVRYVAINQAGQRIRMPAVFGIPGVAIDLDKPKFSYMQGYWGYEVYPLTEDTIEIDINQTELDGNVRVVDPKVTFTIKNSWGFPTRMLVEKLVFVAPNGQEIPLQSTVLENGTLDLGYPSWAAGEVGQTKFTNVFFDRNNSNIDDIFNAQPVRLIYDIDGIANVQQDPDVTGFITDSSVITLQVGVELLLEGSAVNFGADQKVNLNFGDFQDLDTAKISDVEFKLVTENQTPISARLQIVFLDDQDRPIDSLFVDGPASLLNAAPVDGDGIAMGTQRTELFVPMSVARFNRIRNANRGELLTYFTTANDGLVPVKLLATQQSTVKMGLRVRTRF